MKSILARDLSANHLDRMVTVTTQDGAVFTDRLTRLHLGLAIGKDLGFVPSISAGFEKQRSHYSGSFFLLPADSVVKFA